MGKTKPACQTGVWHAGLHLHPMAYLWASTITALKRISMAATSARLAKSPGRISPPFPSRMPLEAAHLMAPTRPGGDALPVGKVLCAAAGAHGSGSMLLRIAVEHGRKSLSGDRLLRRKPSAAGAAGDPHLSGPLHPWAQTSFPQVLTGVKVDPLCTLAYPPCDTGQRPLSSGVIAPQVQSALHRCRKNSPLAKKTARHPGTGPVPPHRSR